MTQKIPLQQEELALQPFQLRVLKILLSIGTTAVLLIWIFESFTDRLITFDAIAYPIMVVMFSCCLVTIQLRPRLVTPVGQLAFYVLAGYITIHVQRMIFEEQSDQVYYDVATIPQWFPLVYTSAFVFFETRRAVKTSIVMYVSILISISYKLMTGPSSFAANNNDPILINMLMAHPVYISTLVGIAWLKTQFVAARNDADIMTQVANIDYLTGVLNRRASSKELQMRMQQIYAASPCLAVLLIDIDHFKRINDTFGHDVGDEILIAVASNLREQLRVPDMLGRWGGEEFIVIAQVTKPADAAELAERLCVAIANRTMIDSLSVTVSIGVTTRQGNETPETLVKQADDALYQAKRLGRNRVEQFPPVHSTNLLITAHS